MFIYSAKSLVFVLAISLAAYALVIASFRDPATRARISRWFAIFSAVTVVAFLMPNFWFAMFIVGALTIAANQFEKSGPALFALLLFALPPMGHDIPGFAGINKFFTLTPPLLFGLALLVSGPAWAKPRSARGGGLQGLIVAAYFALTIVLEMRERSLTDAVRAAGTIAITFIPIYLAFSRWPQSEDDLTSVSLAFVVATMVLAAIGVVETLKHWHLYEALLHTWSLSTLQTYSERSDMLRASASVFNPIAFGYFLAVGLLLSLPLLKTPRSKPFVVATVGLFAAGLIFSLSRGPWVAVILGVFVYAATGPKAVGRIMQLGLGGMAALIVSMATPLGSKILALMPFVGHAAAGTISYRQKLAETGWKVAQKHLFFGTPDFRSDPALEALRQGQGIIDIVNHFLSILLSYGLVGLSLFIIMNLVVLARLWGAIGATRRDAPQMNAFCRAFFAALICTLVVMATTSAVQQIEHVHWLLLGCSAAVCRLAQSARLNVAERAAASAPAAHPAGLAGKPERARPRIDVKKLPAHLRQYVRPRD